MDFELNLDEAVEEKAKEAEGAALRPKVLCVDDEPGNLEVFESYFRDEFRVFTADSGEAGIELLDSHTFDVIVSDQRMPNMLGTKFLAYVRDKSPLTTRIILTGYSDVEDIIDSINSGGVYRYVVKPWNVEELRMTLQNAIGHSQLARENETLLDNLKEANEHLEERVEFKTKELAETTAAKLRHAENLLVQSEKLSQLGQLIASIGHEISNPIMLVSMSVDNEREVLGELERKFSPLFAGSEQAEKVGAIFQSIVSELGENIDHISTGASRLKDLSVALRTQSRRDNEATEGVDINEVCKECLTLVAGRIKLYEVRESLGDLEPVTCFRSRIGQVVTNLLANAADALGEKQARAKAEGGERFRGECSISTWAERRNDRAGVVVAVEDNGDGVPLEIREKVFEQFFTTKPAGKGTGLGLSVCIDIVKSHEGTLEIRNDSSLGGASFELWLPLDS